jgi:hypothetical protein
VAERVVLMHVPDTHFTAGRAIDAGIVVPTLVMRMHSGSLLVLYLNAHEKLCDQDSWQETFFDVRFARYDFYAVI